MEMEAKWYAVYTKPRWEKKVAQALSQQQLENYCPLNKVTRQWSDRKKIVQEPLFTSYVFVHVTEKQHTQLRQVNGILNLVMWLGKPAVIRDEEIEAIRRFLKDHTNVKLERARVKVHDQINITSGPLMNQTGTVVAVKNQSAVVALPTLGYILYAELEKTHVEVINN
ncbi:transcription termination/antitermination protein NusG [Pontibacter mangrovi]|uniref:UpxY family transcription antiterminator n=1 Tax=Pontibacter mangrovi TaxID=2589816 RepID=A0A501W5I0_9BACT|nr:UpxY family transcription antiterminator [Pontibacter mangrovi]TPE42521.1 UpxY family transcription antiterminator [Pontibacter mangrovi]